jgi:hypothetical protein
MQQADLALHPKARGTYDHENIPRQESIETQIFKISREECRNCDESKKRKQIAEWQER